MENHTGEVVEADLTVVAWLADSHTSKNILKGEGFRQEYILDLFNIAPVLPLVS